MELCYIACIVVHVYISTKRKNNKPVHSENHLSRTDIFQRRFNLVGLREQLHIVKKFSAIAYTYSIITG